MSVFSNPASRSAEQAHLYTAAIVALAGDDDPLTVLSQTSALLRTAVAGLTAAQLRRPEAPNKWSMAAIVQHLADSELVWGWRLRMVLSHDRPALTGYDQDLWAERLQYNEADAAIALGEFSVLRAAHLRLLHRASADDLRRVGVHVERGEESVEHILQLYAGHDRSHLLQLHRVRAVVVA